MANKNTNQKPNTGETGKVRGTRIGDSEKSYDNIRKAMEIPPRTGGGSNGSKDNSK